MSTYYFLASVFSLGIKINLFENINEEITLDELSQKINIHYLDLSLIIQILDVVGVVKIENEKIKLNPIHKSGFETFERICKAFDKTPYDKILYDMIYKHDQETPIFFGYEIAQKHLKVQDYFSFHVARELILGKCNTMLDIGGCNGIYATQICNVVPNITIDIYDLPYVQENCENNVKQHGFQDRIKFFVKDITKDKIDKKYDAILMAAILHHLDRKYMDPIINEIASSVTDSGLIILIDLFLDEDRSGPMEYLIHNLSWMGNGSHFNYSVADIADKLKLFNMQLIRNIKSDTRMLVFQKNP
jgi:predicted O-methyltransferase YrrM